MAYTAKAPLTPNYYYKPIEARAAVVGPLSEARHPHLFVLLCELCASSLCALCVKSSVSNTAAPHSVQAAFAYILSFVPFFLFLSVDLVTLWQIFLLQPR